MGNWVLVIHGTGPHHNGKDYDIEHQTLDFLKFLRANGHTISKADVVAGGAIDLLYQERYMDENLKLTKPCDME